MLTPITPEAVLLTAVVAVVVKLTEVLAHQHSVVMEQVLPVVVVEQPVLLLALQVVPEPQS
jgi:hypothetical protein